LETGNERQCHCTIRIHVVAAQVDGFMLDPRIFSFVGHTSVIEREGQVAFEQLSTCDFFTFEEWCQGFKQKTEESSRIRTAKTGLWSDCHR